MDIDEQASDSSVKCECIIHIDTKGRSNEKIVSITEAKWLKVQTAARARSSLLKSSKYDILCRNLPSTFKPQYGYHQSCYSNFTAVPKPQMHHDVRLRGESGNKLLRSDVESTSAGTSGIFKECAFSVNRKRSPKDQLV